MEYKNIEKTFKVVGIESSGLFANFSNEIPASARQFLSRASEIPNRTDTEIALFEPKKDENHIEGRYYVGLIVEESLDEVPAGMDYIELNNNYVTNRGKITELDDLHLGLIKWSDEKGYQRDLDSNALHKGVC